jgi:hypothetical protein
MMDAMEAKHAIEHIRTELNKASKSGVQFIQVSADSRRRLRREAAVRVSVY